MKFELEKAAEGCSFFSWNSSDSAWRAILGCFLRGSTANWQSLDLAQLCAKWKKKKNHLIKLRHLSANKRLHRRCHDFKFSRKRAATIWRFAFTPAVLEPIAAISPLSLVYYFKHSRKRMTVAHMRLSWNFKTNTILPRRNGDALGRLRRQL